MEPLAHSLCGAALARTKLGRLHRLAPISLLVGANLPDVDLAWSYFGHQSYLIYHRGFTHSICGSLLLGLLLAAVMRAIERRRPDSPRSWRPFLLPALLGVLTHPLLDFLNNYGVRPWLPFSDERWYGDLLFIVDPWLWLIFGGIALLAGRRSRTIDVACALLGVATTVVVWWHHRAPLHVRVAYPIGVALIALLRVMEVGSRRPRIVLAGGGLLCAGYLALLVACRDVAVGRALERRPDDERSALHGLGAAPRLVMRSPASADPFHWGLCFEDGEYVRWRTVGVDGAVVPAAVGAPLLRPFDDPLVKVVLRSEAAAPWRYFVRVPWGWVERHADGSARVGLADARFQQSRGRDWASVEVDLTADEVKRAMESGGDSR
jgi:inner membrane protein